MALDPPYLYGIPNVALRKYSMLLDGVSDVVSPGWTNEAPMSLDTVRQEVDVLIELLRIIQYYLPAALQAQSRVNGAKLHFCTLAVGP